MPSRVTASVRMLDDKVHTYDVKMRSNASILIEEIMKDLNILEADYFAIRYKDNDGNLVFLDPLKRIYDQIKTSSKLSFHFVVRFFPHDPGELEEYTRYLVALQIKQDISENLLKCDNNTLTSMLAAIVQAVYGDYELSECEGTDYITSLKILPKNMVPTNEILDEIRDKHIEMKNTISADADSKLLDIAKGLEFYGLRLYPVIKQDTSDVYVAVTRSGFLVYKNDVKLETYVWDQIRKLAFKKHKFLLKLKHEKTPSKKGKVLEYAMKSRDAAKNFWRNCVEHYTFFHLETQPKPKPKPKVFKRGSTFRYSGKTHRQLSDMVRNSNFRRQNFERMSLRGTRDSTSNWSSPSPESIKATIHENGNQVASEGSFTLNPSEEDQSEQLTKIDEESTPEAVEETKNSNGADWQIDGGDLHSNTAKSSNEIKENAVQSMTTAMMNGDGGNHDTNLSSITNPRLPEPLTRANDNDAIVDDHRQLSDQHPPPPLPPKSHGVLLRHRHSFRVMMTSEEGGVAERCTSFTPSELGVAELGSRTPSQYELIESKMIEVGLYAAPKNPPIPPNTPPQSPHSLHDVSSEEETVDDVSCENSEVPGDVIEKFMLQPIKMHFDDDETLNSGDDVITARNSCLIGSNDSVAKVIADDVVEL